MTVEFILVAQLMIQMILSTEHRGIIMISEIGMYSNVLERTCFAKHLLLKLQVLSNIQLDVKKSNLKSIRRHLLLLSELGLMETTVNHIKIVIVHTTVKEYVKTMSARFQQGKDLNAR
eukprot:CAMPEP_0196999952 /NCGR_PEP_ID=MMETSP1380-20130617/5024_1 /TAXON_ID=5936 /ORGANISM="Euplotes crassus, Strain CT5" /LENGTH=117 /DNA_ID=CAMNT_0042417083 /DNA_START=61 /DNA_END=414 /DNA_ORIENTATION=-